MVQQDQASSPSPDASPASTKKPTAVRVLAFVGHHASFGINTLLIGKDVLVQAIPATILAGRAGFNYVAAHIIKHRFNPANGRYSRAMDVAMALYPLFTGRRAGNKGSAIVSRAMIPVALAYEKGLFAERINPLANWFWKPTEDDNGEDTKEHKEKHRPAPEAIRNVSEGQMWPTALRAIHSRVRDAIFGAPLPLSCPKAAACTL